MAELEEILVRKWPGNTWTFYASGDYSTLVWTEGNPQPKPTLEEILAFNDEVDVILAAEVAKAAQESAFFDAAIGRHLDTAEAVIKAVAELQRVVEDVRSKILETARADVFVAWDPQVIQAVQDLGAEIAEIRTTVTE